MEEQMKIGILPFEQFYGKTNIGSSRIRGTWLAKYWPESEIFRMGQKYDVIIFQKVYWIEFAELIRKEENECDCIQQEEESHWDHTQACNTRVHRKPKAIFILDMCDADFQHWGYRIKQMIDLCDAVTTSTPALAEYMQKLTDKPVWCIPDRLDLTSFDLPPKVHAGDAKVAAWYGYSENFPMLDAAINALIKNKFTDLLVIASKRQPYQLPPAAQGKITLTNFPWTPETVNSDLQKADIILNPQSKTGRFKYKSNNKTIAAWALGLPVAHTPEELVAFIPEAARKGEVEKRLKEIKEDYDVHKSVESFKKLIEEIILTRKE